MTRRLSVVALAAALAGAAGCRSSCGSLGSLTSHTRGPAPCQLVGSGGRPVGEGCFDAITGAPIPCPPDVGVIPGGGYPSYPAAPGPAPGGPPNELPFPAPSDLIPRPGVPMPYAPTSPAPGDGFGLGTTPKGGATPVKATNK